MTHIPFWVVVMLTWLIAFAVTVILLHVAPARAAAIVHGVRLHGEDRHRRAMLRRGFRRSDARISLRRAIQDRRAMTVLVAALVLLALCLCFRGVRVTLGVAVALIVLVILAAPRRDHVEEVSETIRRPVPAVERAPLPPLPEEAPTIAQPRSEEEAPPIVPPPRAPRKYIQQ
jgi:hypothetical protein